MLKYFFVITLVPFLFGGIYSQKTVSLFDNTVPLFKDSIWILKTEVSNLEYLTYVNSSIVGFTESEAALLEPNKFLWNSIPNKPKPYQDYYFKHPAYDAFPVVNITREQALAFCKWKTKELNSYLDILTEKERKGINKIEVRLPKNIEWKFAALGGLPGYSDYPWKGLGMREERGRDIGMFRANFKDNYGEIRVGKNKINAVDDLIAPINSFYKNGYGLYNMSGNVAELIEDQYIVRGGHWNSFKDELRLDAFEHYTGPSPTIGFRYVIEVVN